MIESSVESSLTPHGLASGISHGDISHTALWMWPQILSLDVVAIFASWHILFTLAFAIPVRMETLLSGGICVWCIYIADHLLDAYRHRGITTERHLFARSHRRSLVPAMAFALLLGAGEALRIPRPVQIAGIGLAAAVLLYLLGVHVGGECLRSFWPREFVVALIFSAAAAISAWSQSAQSSFALLGTALFAAICVLNCAGLEYLEWLAEPHLPEPHSAVVWVGRHAVAFGVALLAACVPACFAPELRPICLSVALSSALLCGLFTGARHRDTDRLRALADISLLTPCLVLLALYMR